MKNVTHKERPALAKPVCLESKSSISIHTIGLGFLLSFFILLFTSLSINAQDFNQIPMCAEGGVIDWGTGAGKVEWPEGSLNFSANDVQGTGVDFTFSVTGSTGALSDAAGIGVTPPGIADWGHSTKSEDRAYFGTSGIGAGNIKITIDVSPSIKGDIGFDMYHFNQYLNHGDHLTVIAYDDYNRPVYATFTGTNNPTWTTVGMSPGEVEAVGSTTTDQSQLGVNLTSFNPINKIEIIWEDCDACNAAELHAFTMGDFAFCTRNMDQDADGLSDVNDLDDDNDGIPDADEFCGTSSSSTNTTIDVNILPDDYGSETTWTLKDAGGATVLSGGPYADNDRTLKTDSYTGPIGVYSFDIYDTYGDGISYPVNGYYEVVVDGNTEVDKVWGNWGSSANHGIDANINPFFCIGGSDPAADDDGDDIPNYKDADYCTLNANGVCETMDTDGDGIIDSYDLDADNDGIPDIIEAGGIDTNGNGIVDEQQSADGDFVPDNIDADVQSCTDTSPYDGICDSAQGGTDTDGDGIQDSSDPDADGNGIDDAIESTPLDLTDTDGDSFPDFLDLDADNDGIPDVVEAGGIDTNGDGRVDDLTDADGDGYADDVDPVHDGPEAGNNADPGTTDPMVETDASGNLEDGATDTTLDKDNDGLADHIDLDADNDGIPDIVESNGIDTNGDGRVDNSTDNDDDGLADIYDENTNDGPGTGGSPNGVALVETNVTGEMVEGDSGEILDTDGDSIPDHLDLDADNDGIADIIEAGGLDPEGDGFVDTGLAPWDSDNDGLADVFDQNVADGPGPDGATNGTALVMTNADTDNDGTVDPTLGEQMIAGGGGANNINADNDSAPNHLDLDADNDGIVDVVEAGGTDNNGDGMQDGSDTDNDGFSDLVDGDVGNDGAAESTANALIVANSDAGDTDTRPEYSGSNTADTDGDDVPDYLDVDADNDGLYDNYEGQSTAGYIAPGTTDTDGDGLLDAYDNSIVFGGTGIDVNAGGQGDAYDHDSDGTPDYLDLDADNDNILDQQEAWDDIADGDSMEDNVTNCNNEDADGDGLVDCFDADDADALNTTWADNPADDMNGPTGTSAGTVFTDDLLTILPENGGDSNNEPDYRDYLDVCGSSLTYYALTEQGGETTSYAYNSATGKHIDGGGTQVIRATAYCEPEADNWYYYYNPLAPANYLFAIKQTAGTMTRTDEWLDFVEIKVEDINDRKEIASADGTIVMGRDWTIAYKPGASLPAGAEFSIRFFYEEQELIDLHNLSNEMETQTTAGGGTVNSRSFVWFKKTQGFTAADLSADGTGLNSAYDNLNTMVMDPAAFDFDFANVNTTPGAVTTDGVGGTDVSTAGNSKNFVQFDGLTSFSGGTGMITTTGSNLVLPVELTNFSARTEACDVVVNWTSASEEGFSHYELQWSDDGRTFKTIKSVNGTGGVAEAQTYIVVDEGARGENYYRLKMNDFDGTVEYSDVIFAKSDCDAYNLSMSVYPNPAIVNSSDINISFDADEFHEKIVVTDMLGRTMKIIALDQDQENLSLDINGMPSGTYFLSLVSSRYQVITKRLIIQE